jgi:DNA polymerase-3 subunit delta'
VVLEAALKRFLPEASAAERASLTRLSGGSIGAALTLATGDGAALAEEADRLIDGARSPDVLKLLDLGERLWRIRDGLELFGGFLLESLSARIRQRARKADAGNLEPWVALLARLDDDFSRAVGLNLEPRQTLLSAARDLSHVAQARTL